LSPVFQSKGVYKFLQFNKKGTQASFLGDLDSTATKIRPFHLYHWKEKGNKTELLVDNQHQLLPSDWMLSEFGRPRFSENGKRLFFGIAPKPILEDSLLLDEDKVEVEVWSWNDAKLYTQQESQLTNDKEKYYTCVWDIAKNKFHQ